MSDAQPKQQSPRRGDWICTFTGQKVWPFDPRPEEIKLEDIAHSLAMQCRWTGHTTEFYSVAQHACMVASLVERVCPAYALAALHHDSPEAYFHDTARPTKQFLLVRATAIPIEQEGVLKTLAQAEDILSDVIRFALGISKSHAEPEELAVIKAADNAALKIESEHLMPFLAGNNYLSTITAPYWQWEKGWAPEYAKMNFLTMHSALKEKQCTLT
jgi:5'-deoxynucleotidase YfbR-like HD superfamily hydrolase